MMWIVGAVHWEIYERCEWLNIDVIEILNINDISNWLTMPVMAK